MSPAGSGYIDLRSDTVTKPSAAMRQAMAQAEVGDDWFGDDPTVNRLQDRAAELTGRQAALYLPTGTMCNQIAMHAFARAGHLVVCEESAHVAGMELSSSAVLSGIAFRRLAAPARGLLTVAQVAEALAPDLYDVTVVDLVTIGRGGLSTARCRVVPRCSRSRRRPMMARAPSPTSAELG